MKTMLNDSDEDSDMATNEYHNKVVDYARKGKTS